jgi:flagellar assembly factor FliW
MTDALTELTQATKDIAMKHNQATAFATDGLVGIDDDAGHAETLTFTTRFGEVSLRSDRILAFPHGLFGFRECTQFGLAKLPNVEGSPLMLMQCVNQPAIAFLVADPEALGVGYSAADRQEALEETKLSTVSTQMLTILTLYDAGENYYLTANLKAPVLIDSNRKAGVQFILSNKSYSTQHKV